MRVLRKGAGLKRTDACALKITEAVVADLRARDSGAVWRRDHGVRCLVK